MNVVQIPRRFVTDSWGGTETVVLETTRRLRARGHASEILCPAALGRPGRDSVQGVPVHRVPYFYPYLGLSPAARSQLDQSGGNLFSWHLMAALWRHPGLELVHLHTGKRLGGAVRWVARRRRVPYVISLHGGVHDVPAAEAGRWTAPTAGSLEWGKALGLLVGSRRVLDDAAAVICVGAQEREATAARLPGRRVEYLPNGVDPGRFARGDRAGFRAAQGFAADDTVLLVVGRVAPQKNQRLAAQILARLLPRWPRARLLIVGPVNDPEYAAALGRDLQAPGLRGRATLLPGQLDGQRLVDAFHAADALLLPSVHEPFGIVVLEAWAAGLPVVAARVGGVPYFVEDGRTGWLFDSGDAAAAAERLLALCADADARRALGAAGRELARREYSWDRITERLLALYEDVLRRHR